MKPSNPEDPKIITLNIGGKIFQTTKQTLTQAGPNSFLSQIQPSNSPIPNSNSDPIFIDRDPELFSTLLSLLRTGNLPNKTLDLQTLILESKFYGIETLLAKSITDPLKFNPYTLQRSLLLPLNGRDLISSISTTSFGYVHVAHGCKVTTFDWSLTRKSTVLTQFIAIDSLYAVSPDVIACGANDFDGLEIIDMKNDAVIKNLKWVNSTRSSSNVQAIGSNDDNGLLFVSFESGRRNSNVIVVYDVVSGFRPVSEIANNEIYGAEFDAGMIPSTKLSWVSSNSLLMASGSHSGPNGVVGSIKLWDVRSGSLVWELKDNVDCFADVAVSSSSGAMFKVGVNSGEVFFLDMRMLGSDDSQWVCLGNRTKLISAKKEGLGAKVECHGGNVFVSKGGDVELWSEVLLSSSGNVVRSEDRIFKSNVMGRAKDLGGNRITNLRFGGSKMFVTRKDQLDIEVWQSSAIGL